MRSIILSFLAAISWEAAAAEIVFDFNSYPLDKTPPGIYVALPLCEHRREIVEIAVDTLVKRRGRSLERAVVPGIYAAHS